MKIPLPSLLIFTHNSVEKKKSQRGKKHGLTKLETKSQHFIGGGIVGPVISFHSLSLHMADMHKKIKGSKIAPHLDEPFGSTFLLNGLMVQCG